ncbi:MAG: serine hydrolase domain-containing protein [Bacillota bacterium]
MADERYKDITVRMLLNHSSGILGTLMFSTMTYGIPSTRYHDSLLPQLAKQRLKADPGEFSVYCNDGFSLAEIIVERVSGMSFSEFVRQRITESVGMTNTKTPQDDFDRTRMARTFFQGEITPYDNCNAIGLGGVYSTAEDLCKLAQAYMDDPGSVAAAELLSDEMRTASMQKEYLRGIWPEPGEGVIGYGLGWDSVGPNFFSEYGIQALFKGGDTVLYHSLLMVLPEHNMAFAVVMSSGSSIMYGLPMAQSVLSQALLAEGKIKEIFPLQDLRAPVASEVPIEAHGVCRPLRQQLRGKRDSNQPGWQSHGDTFVQRRHTQRDLLLYVGWRFCE